MFISNFKDNKTLKNFFFFSIYYQLKFGNSYSLNVYHAHKNLKVNLKVSFFFDPDVIIMFKIKRIILC